MIYMYMRSGIPLFWAPLGPAFKCVLIKGGVPISEVVHVACVMHSVLIKGGVLISGVSL